MYTYISKKLLHDNLIQDNYKSCKVFAYLTHLQVLIVHDIPIAT